MLQRLRGERHRVISGVTVIDVATGKTITEACESIVYMRDMRDACVVLACPFPTPRLPGATFAMATIAPSPTTSCPT